MLFCRIVKVIRIKPYQTNLSLCPVTAFEALRDHPAADSRPSDILLSAPLILVWLLHVTPSHVGCGM